MYATCNTSPVPRRVHNQTGETVKLKSTKDAASSGIKALVYGLSGIGKTALAATTGDLPHTIIASAENGLLSLRKFDIDAVQIDTIDDLYGLWDWLTTDPAGLAKKWLIVDSISEVAEVILSSQKKVMVNGKLVDPRQAYGAMQDQMIALIRAFRDLPLNVIMIAKCEKAQDENGRMLNYPSTPGNKLGQQLPYLFDEVWAMRVQKDAHGIDHRVIQTQPCFNWTAKDRSGSLDDLEAPNLAEILAKITNTPTQTETE